MEIIQAFGCSHCGMASRLKSSVRRHENNTCKKNNDRKTCLNCNHYSLESETIYNPNHGGDPGSTDYDVLKGCCAKDVDIDDLSQNQNNECSMFNKEVKYEANN